MLRLKLPGFSEVLGFGYRHPWLSRSVKKQEKGLARAVGMHALGTYADVRAEILSLKHRGPSSSPQDFYSILFPVVPSLLAVLELAASIHGCDLKHSGYLQLEYPAKPSSRHGFATHGTHDSWQGHWQLFRRLHLARDSHLIDW